MDLNTSLTHKMSCRKTTLHCFIEILYNFLCKTPLNIHHFQWKAKGCSSRLRMWDHVPVFWTSSSNLKPSAPASNMSSAANSHQINWRSYKFPSKIHRFLNEGLESNHMLPVITILLCKAKHWPWTKFGPNLPPEKPIFIWLVMGSCQPHFSKQRPHVSL